MRLTKDYRFCRGQNATDLYVNEGNGGKLLVQRVNGGFVAPFKYNGVFTVSSLRMRADTLEEEILSAEDKPGAENAVVSMRTLSIHLIKMKRMSD